MLQILFVVLPIIFGCIFAIQLNLVLQIIMFPILGYIYWKINDTDELKIVIHICVIFFFFVGICIGNVYYYFNWYDGHGYNIPNPFVPFHQ